MGSRFGFGERGLEEIRLLIEGEFAGGEPDIASAKDLLRMKNLASDLDLRNLIEFRGHAPNPLKSISVKVMFAEAERHIENLSNIVSVKALAKGRPRVSWNGRRERS